MKNPYTVYYKKPHNPNKRIARNAVRGIGCRPFESLEAVKAFAKDHNIIRVYNSVGFAVQI